MKGDGRGGARPNSGRKPDLNKKEVIEIKKKISEHGLQIDEKTKKTRILSLLDKLYDIGISDGNIYAIKEYFDRQLGKSIQTNQLVSESDDPITINFNLSNDN